MAIVHKNAVSVDIKRKGIAQTLEFFDTYVTHENRSLELIAVHIDLAPIPKMAAVYHSQFSSTTQ